MLPRALDVGAARPVYPGVCAGAGGVCGGGVVGGEEGVGAVDHPGFGWGVVVGGGQGVVAVVHEGHVRGGGRLVVGGGGDVWVDVLEAALGGHAVGA